MNRPIKQKLLLPLMALVLGVGLFCTSYGIFRFTAASWYPDRNSVKDLGFEIERLSHGPGKPRAVCLRISSLVISEDQTTDVDNWYRRQGWEELYFQGNTVGLWQFHLLHRPVKY